MIARSYSLLEYNVPRSKLKAAEQITPGFNSPTVSALEDPAWCAVRVMVRPEQLDVSVHEDGSPTPGGGLRGRVEQCRYYGHDALLEIRAEEPGIARALLARVHGEQALAVGTAVRVLARGPVTPID